jgi:hypothetical protein
MARAANLSTPTTEVTTMNKNPNQKYPLDWEEKRVREVIEHYENQIEDEQYAEIEAAQKAENITMMAVPTELVPKVRALIAKNRSA